jgi:hypothetical protein
LDELSDLEEYAQFRSWKERMVSHTLKASPSPLNSMSRLLATACIQSTGDALTQADDAQGRRGAAQSVGERHVDSNVYAEGSGNEGGGRLELFGSGESDGCLSFAATS